MSQRSSYINHVTGSAVSVRTRRRLTVSTTRRTNFQTDTTEIIEASTNRTIQLLCSAMSIVFQLISNTRIVIKNGVISLSNVWWIFTMKHIICTTTVPYAGKNLLVRINQVFLPSFLIKTQWWPKLGADTDHYNC